MKEPIKCIVCGIERLVPRACLKTVKRCKPCQADFNRDQARNRYRKINNIPIDAPISCPIQIKKPAKQKPQKPQISPIFKPKPRINYTRTPSTPKKFTKAEINRAQKIFKLLGGGHGDDDW